MSAFIIGLVSSAHCHMAHAQGLSSGLFNGYKRQIFFSRVAGLNKNRAKKKKRVNFGPTNIRLARNIRPNNVEIMALSNLQCRCVDM